MEPGTVRSGRRGRPKRQRKEGDNGSLIGQGAPEIKKRVVGKALLGRYVKKEFGDSGLFLGKIVSYDCGYYRVDYEDEDCEDLESGEVRQLLIREDDFNNDTEMMRRRTNLDTFLFNKINTSAANAAKKLSEMQERVELSSLNEESCGPTREGDGAQADGCADSSSDSCEYVHEGDLGLDAETHLGPPPQLPASSGNIGVPEECVSHLFSVYSFLRSFSVRLFLSPFGLDDFVGSLNCDGPNTLLDAIHVALMRVLSRHLENLSSDGSEIASKCVRRIDWSLLDMLTWPVYVVHYLTAMRYAEGPEWKGFYFDVLDVEYYKLPARRKLLILQILCDDVLDSVELRAEIDMREAAEFEADSDELATNNHHEFGPRRVHPRYSKTSACMDQEAMEISSEGLKAKLVCNSNSFGLNGSELASNAADIELDNNGDECRLCGMDGTLLCCDGCPSAYHSRCIGVNKSVIPEGPWFCPECKFNKTRPSITKGTSLGSAEIFGIDLFQQVFLGSCDHLLVLKVSVNEDSCLRYYNQNDILKVLQTLYSSDHRDLYSGICKAILQYWKISENIIFPTEMAESLVSSASKKEDAKSSTLLLPLTARASQADLNVDGNTNFVGSLTENNVENLAGSFPQTSSGSLRDMNGLQNSDHTNEMNPGQLIIDPTVSTGSVSHQAAPSDLMPRSLADRSSGVDVFTSENSNASNRVHANNSTRLPMNMSSQRRECNVGICGNGSRGSFDVCLYMGSFFKSQAYTNQYAHGDFAASAAANLAALSAEENRVSEARALENPRKVLSAEILLQIKAFSSAAIRFFWPNPEKKTVEVPRERCAWCLSCKAPVTSKKACLLNSAAMSVIRSAVKILAGFRPIKNVDGSLPAIAMYILYMAESLCGLMGGPFVSPSFRKQWHMRVEQATTCRTLKSLLLELEENIYVIALSGEWVKVVDHCLNESSVAHSTAFTAGSIQRRGPGRRPKNQSTTSEVTDDDSSDKLNDFSWWRGGKVCKLLYQKGILPHKIVKKAARQGGTRKMSGVTYAEGFEIPKVSKQTVWRAAVESSRNASQLALQVRYLDLHIRWTDLSRPEQNLQDGKGPETEASAFRNANVCNKKLTDNKVQYGVRFGNQKHLPSRVMKNVVEVEESPDGKDTFWFSETRIPLYLIKEYEGKADKVLPHSDGKSSDILSVMQRRQLKASRKDIFSYLMQKRDNLQQCSCASCQLDVLLGIAVKCRICQGYCHADCTIKSKVQTSGEIMFLFTCKLCYRASGFTQNQNNNESPTSPLPSRVRDYQNMVAVTKSAGKNGYSQPVAHMAPVMPLESFSGRRPALDSIVAGKKDGLCSKSLKTSSAKKAGPDSSVTTKKRGLSSWGLIWKKKKENEGNGFEFRVKNLILKGNPDLNWLKPTCYLCRKPYDSDLMYICCETCTKWYHADAVQLEESKILDLLGFKCCKCRRIRSPVCPLSDPESRKPEGKKTRSRVSKGSSGVDSDSGPISDQSKDREGPTSFISRKDEVLSQDDLLATSHSRFEWLMDHEAEPSFECNASFMPGPQKLPVRRQAKHEDIDCFTANGPSFAQPAATVEADAFMDTAPVLEFDGSSSGLGDNLMFEYDDFNVEDMEFEPQTYFSFTELLASEDDGQLDGVDPSAVLSGNMDNVSSAVSEEEVLKQYGLVTSNDRLDPPVPANIPHCRICSQIEPVPDLYCQTCGLFMHVSCSSWGELPSSEDGWKCGSCREWR